MGRPAKFDFDSRRGADHARPASLDDHARRARGPPGHGRTGLGPHRRGIGAVRGEPGGPGAAYAIAKAAEETLLRTIAREVASTGVTANLVVVRKIDANHARETEPSPKNAAWTTPEEIAATMRFPCSDAAAAINGAIRSTVAADPLTPGIEADARRARAFAEPARRAGDDALPDRLRHRRGVGVRHRLVFRMDGPRDGRAIDRARLRFGYTLTVRQLLATGVVFAQALRLAFASDTISITVMEIVDTIIVLAIPGAMAAGLADPFGRRLSRW